MPANAGPPPTADKFGRKADRCFIYRDAKEQVLGAVLRWEAGNGASKKRLLPVTFWRDHRTGKEGWDWKGWPDPRPLYGLNELALAFEGKAKVVVLFEGEKKADAVTVYRGPFEEAFLNAGAVGVSWSGGAEAIEHADFSPLAGRDRVIVCPDNDAPGEKAADKAVEMLHRVGVRRVQRWKAPKSAPERWDIADPIPAGLTPEDIVQSILTAPECKPPRGVLMKEDFLTGFSVPQYLVAGMLQRGFLYSLTGATGAGKSAIALYLAAVVSHKEGGQKFGPHDVEQGRVLYIARENATDIRMRMRMIGMEEKAPYRAAGTDYLVIEAALDILGKDLPSITKEVEAIGPLALVIVDTSAAMFSGDDENNNAQAGNHARRLRKLCELPGNPTVLTLCHPTKWPKGPDELLPRGGGAFVAEVDGNLTAWAHDNRLTDLHWGGKIRGPGFEKITFKMETIHTPRLVDSRGRRLPTVMARVVSEAEATDEQEAAIIQENQLLRAMLKRQPDGVSLSQLAKDCGWLLTAKPGDQPQPNKSLIQRVMKRLNDDKLVMRKRGTWILKPEGEKMAQKVGGESKAAKDEDEV